MARQFISGETVIRSGIYSVTHQEHRLPHEVTLLQGQRFPKCSRCGAEVRFALVRAAALMEERRERILLYALPEITSEPTETATPAEGDPTATDVARERKPKPRAKAHKKGKS